MPLTHPAREPACVCAHVGGDEGEEDEGGREIGSIGTAWERPDEQLCVSVRVGGWVGREGGMQWAACVSTSARGKGGQHGRYHRTFACAFAPFAILDVQRECLGGLCLF
jgi:hypothetical protein